MNIDRVIDDAIEIIERDGWNQGSYAVYDDRPDPAVTDDDADYAHWQAARNAPVCAMGAIYRALTGSAYGYCIDGDGDADKESAHEEMTRVRNLVVERIVGVLTGVPGVGEGYGLCMSDIINLNDNPATTKEDVLLMFKRARHGE